MQDAKSEIAAIEAVERRRQQALVSLDTDALRAIFADDLIHVHSTGMAHTKDEFIAHLLRMGGFRSIERGPLDIRVEGPFAIMTGRTINGVRSPETGEDVTLDGFNTQVFRKGRDGWQVVLSQLTPSRARPGQK